MNDTSIIVEVRHVYGERKVYPHCDKARHFARIADTKTLTPRVLAHIENLGYRIETESDSRRTEARQRHQPARNPLQPIQESNWPPHADDSAYE